MVSVEDIVVFRFKGVKFWQSLYVFFSSNAQVTFENNQLFRLLTLRSNLDLIKNVYFIRRFTGDPALSLPNKVRRHPWLADPYALGTWSYPSIYSTHQVCIELEILFQYTIEKNLQIKIKYKIDLISSLSAKLLLKIVIFCREMLSCWVIDPPILQDYKELSTPLPSPKVPRLLLAGEHVHSQYWSFMHGARLSGIFHWKKTTICRDKSSF